jgi:glucose-6-phosphate isomerase
MLGINYSNMMEDIIGPSGFKPGFEAALGSKAAAAHEEIAGRKRPEMGFLELPAQDVSRIKEYGKWVREGSDAFVLLGIGGSALGPKAILECLSPMHNITSSPKVFICDNVDPHTLTKMLSNIKLERAAVNVITKSGTTAETMSAFMILYDRMQGLKDRVIATTDPDKGYLREIVKRDGLKNLPIPPGVGGRYSVLCPVGLLLAEVAGGSSEELLSGAADMLKRCASADAGQNPAYLFATMLYLMHTERSRNINVMIPYTDRLRPIAEWFCQLWSESLGKQGKGSTPYPSIGTTDQHSQLQLWMEGPQDKVVVFIRVEDHGSDLTIPKLFGDSGVGFLGGHSMAELINAEEEATELSLARAGRPNMTITLPRLDAYHLGGLFMFFEIATAYAGFLYGINPFDQPSVEESKNFTYGMMGRKGYEERKAIVEDSRRKKSAWKL